MYEYKCAHCGKRFEVLQKFSDAPLSRHDECGSGPVERLISAPALQFKGTGWYVTDYAKNNGGPAGNGSGGGSESKTESTSEKKGESKTESGAKSEGKGAEGSKSEPKTPAPSSSPSSGGSGS